MDNLKEMKKVYIKWLSEYGLDDDFVKKGIHLIKDCKNEYNVINTYKVLTAAIAHKNDIALKGAKIVSKALEEYQAYLAGYVLTSYPSVIRNVALEGATIICKTDNKNKAVIIKDALISTPYDNKKEILSLVDNIYKEKSITKARRLFLKAMSEFRLK